MKYIKSFSSITEKVESPIIEKVESFISKPQMETMIKKYQSLLSNNNVENKSHLEYSLSKMKRSLEKIDKEINDLRTKIKEATKKIRSFGDKNPTKKDTLKTDILNWKLELKKLEGTRVNESLENDIFSEKDIKNFCNLWGQSNEEAAANLGFDEKDPGFIELMMGHDYIWVEKYNVWIPDSNSFYTEEDDEMIQYIKSNQ